jgi:hypothetical protein
MNLDNTSQAQLGADRTRKSVVVWRHKTRRSFDRKDDDPHLL